MQKEKPETESVFFCRFLTDSSAKSVSLSALLWAVREIMGVGMFFLPQDELKRNQAKNIFEVIVKKEGLNFLGWREVRFIRKYWEKLL